MGIDLCVGALAGPNTGEPDWVATGDAIARLDPAAVLDTGDEWFPIEYWLRDALPATPPVPWATYCLLREAQATLRAEAAAVRATIEAPAGGVLAVDLPDGRVNFVCDTDGNGFPEIVNSFVNFGESGLAAAAGFEYWTQYASKPLEERSLSWLAGDDVRLINAVRAYTLAEDVAAGRAGIAPGPSVEPIKHLASRLVSAVEIDPRNFEAVTRSNLERIAEEPDLPTVESFDELPMMTTVCAAGEPDLDRVRMEIATLALGLGDVSAGDLAALRVSSFELIEPGEIPPQSWRDWIAWCAESGVDWVAAEQAAGGNEDDGELAHDLEIFQGYVEDGWFSRMILSEKVGAVRIWLAADYGDYSPEMVLAIRRLGAAGVLKEAGVLGWGAPAPG
jgi:hypothetical protein